MLTCRRCGGLTPPESSSDCLHCDAPLPRPPRWARRLSALLGPAGAILLAACYGGPGRYHGAREPMPAGVTRSDHDHDGVRGGYECRYPAQEDCARQLPPPDEVDCNDTDPAIFPGAADVDGDGVDGNCDGVDGWADPAVIRAYAAPPPSAASPPAVVAEPPATP